MSAINGLSTFIPMDNSSPTGDFQKLLTDGSTQTTLGLKGAPLGSGGSGTYLGYAGSATIKGDPHFDVQNTNRQSDTKFDFQGVAGNTYNLLSDPATGFEINALFVPYSGNNGNNVVGAEGISFDGHKLEIDANGKVLLDGQALSAGTYFNGALQVANNGNVTLKADNFTVEATHQGSGAGAYIDTSISTDNGGDLNLGLGGIVGSVISNANAKTDAQTNSTFQVSSLFAQGQANQNGGVSQSDSALGTDLTQTASYSTLLDDLSQVKGSGSVG